VHVTAAQANQTLTATATLSIEGRVTASPFSSDYSTDFGPSASALSQSDQVLSAAAVASWNATLASLQPDNSVSASAVAGWAASAVIVQFDQVLSAAGGVTSVGHLAALQSDNAASTAVSVRVRGAVSVSQAPNTAATSSAVGLRGSAAIVQDAQTVNATGGVVLGGALAAGQASQLAAHATVLVASGTPFSPDYSTDFGPSGFIQVDQALSASAISRWQAPLAATQGPQVLAGTGSVVASGGLSATQDDQRNALGVSIVAGARLIQSQADHTFAGSGVLGVRGSLATQQEPQQVAASAGPIMALSLATTQGPNTLSAAGSAPISVALAASQASQGVQGSAGGLVSGSGALAQPQQSLSASGQPIVAGNGAAQQAGQTLSASAASAIEGRVTARPFAADYSTDFGPLAISQDAQALSAAGGPISEARLTAVQQDNASSATAEVLIGGHISVSQDGNAPSVLGKVFSGLALSVRQSNQGVAAAGKVVIGAGLSVQQPSNAIAAEASLGQFGATATQQVLVAPLLREVQVGHLRRTALSVPLARLVQVQPLSRTAMTVPPARFVVVGLPAQRSTRSLAHDLSCLPPDGSDLALTMSRLITVPAQASPLAATVAWWPKKRPTEVLDYELEISAPLIDAGDDISNLSISIAPSGSGELQPVSVALNGTRVVAWLSGGVPGRSYTVKLDASTTGGRTFEWLVGIEVSSATGQTAAASPSTDYGPSLFWPPGADFSQALNSGYIALVSGF
jgi:hypothetical protein